MMPLAYIAASLRSALADMREAEQDLDEHRFKFAASQAEKLIEELERHDGARKRETANDVTAGE